MLLLIGALNKSVYRVGIEPAPPPQWRRDHLEKWAEVLIIRYVSK